MFKKRTLKTTSKRRNPDDDLDSDSVTSISGEIPKRAKFPAKTAVSSSNEPKVSSEPPKVTGKEPEHRENETLDHEKDSPDPKKVPKVSGPKGAPKNVRVTTLTDFQPDVCKDFQQTGYCGYGDTCKFLHIRDESKVTKAVEKEWETAGKKMAKMEEIPFKCVMCRTNYTNPVKTLCGHIFCRKCFMDRFRAGKSKCVICRQETGGSVQPTTVT